MYLRKYTILVYNADTETWRYPAIQRFFFTMYGANKAVLKQEAADRHFGPAAPVYAAALRFEEESW